MEFEGRTRRPLRDLGRLWHVVRRSPRTTVLILLHLFVFNGLFVFRFSPMREAVEQRIAWAEGGFEGGIADHVRLHFSTIVERNYYEWSRAVLGKRLEPGYPMFDSNRAELERLLSEPGEPRLPYRDIPFEYPPLAMLPILAAGAFADGFVGFARAFALLASAAYLVSLLGAYRLWQKLPSGERSSWNTVLLLSLLGMLCLGQLYVTRLDAFPSLLTVLAVWAFVAQRWYQSAVWLALGALAKAYPVVVAPAFALLLIHERKYRELAIAAGIVVGIVGGANLAMAWVTDGAFWDSYRFHASRGIQIESLYALVAYASHLLLNTPITVYEAHNSMNIDVGYAGILLALSNIMPAACLGVIYWMFWRGLRKGDVNETASWMVGGTLILVLAFILTFRVLSPQFLIWLTPLIYLFAPARRRTFFGLFLALLVVTQLIWPGFYWLLEEARPAGVLLLAVRNIGLVALLGWMVAEWRGAGSRERGAVRGER